MDSTSAANDDDETRELLRTPVGDRCASCQAPLANDQRYCVNCGERRGKGRFSFAAMAAQAAPAPAPAPSPQRNPRVSSGATLVAGVGTLLLAMGVGVLIGNTNGANNQPARASAPAVQVVRIGGGGGGASTGRGASSNTAIKSPKVHLSKKVLKAATAAAGKVLGTSANLAPPTVAVGGNCSHGAGCQGGKFTGNFFGGG